MDSKKIEINGVYKSHLSYDDNARFIITGVGLSHVLIADHPLIKLNEVYLEYCVTRKEFERDFELVGENK